MRFRDVQHQPQALALLRRALASGRTHHAYLFEGPEGVGKELMAIALAARLLCEDEMLAPDDDSCGACAACRLVAVGNHPDLHLIHRGLHKLHPDRAVRQRKGLFLAVDLVRHFLIEPATMKPTRGRRRVFILRDAERMNEGAQNALLKTLEEPPGAATLILVTSSAARLLPTIRSRCQQVRFGALPPDFVAEQLAARAALGPPGAAALARLADGRLGVALRWHKLDLLACGDTVADGVARVAAGDPESVARSWVEVATELGSRWLSLGDVDEEESEDEPSTARSSAKSVPTDVLRDALKLVLMLVAAVYRDALVAHVQAGSPRLLPQQAGCADQLAAQASESHLGTCVQAVHEAERMLDRNVAPQQACEWLAVACAGELTDVLGRAG